MPKVVENLYLDPETASELEDEIEAVGAGYGPLNADLEAELDQHSLAASEFSDAQQEAKAVIARMGFLKKVVSLLPVAHRNEQVASHGEGWQRPFVLDGPQVQSRARKLQSHVLWLGNPKGSLPYYVLGQSLPSDSTDYPLVLLGSAERPSKIRILKVNRSDLEIRNSLNFSEEFTQEAIERMIDPDTAKVMLSSSTPGSIYLTRDRRGNGTPERVIEEGIRAVGFRIDSNDYPYNQIGKKLDLLTDRNNISAEEWRVLRVGTIVAGLINAFGVNGQIDKILGKSSKEAQAPVEKIIAQNRTLRATLRTMMLGAGVLTTQEVDDLLAKKFPPLV